MRVLIVGAGLFGATCAEILSRQPGYEVKVVEREEEVGGMCHTTTCYPYYIHDYGAHIFRTDNEQLWRYMNRFDYMRPYNHCPIAVNQGKLYNLPFNLHTLNQIYGDYEPAKLLAKLNADKVPCENPQNLEQFALANVGHRVYNILIREYTEKQWGKPCTELPPSIMSRLPIRNVYDNNYYMGKPFQGVPENGYTHLIQNMLVRCDVILGEKDNKYLWNSNLGRDAEKIIYTGPLDELFSYCLGKLPFRQLKFELKEAPTQGISVINWTDKSVPYTRTIEHARFLSTEAYPRTLITYETPVESGGLRLYPTADGIKMQKDYEHLALATFGERFIIGGRMGTYQYTDMEDTLKNAMKVAQKILNGG